jgi:hypothetical protein
MDEPVSFETGGLRYQMRLMGPMGLMCLLR